MGVRKCGHCLVVGLCWQQGVQEGELASVLQLV